MTVDIGGGQYFGARSRSWSRGCYPEYLDHKYIPKNENASFTDSNSTLCIHEGLGEVEEGNMGEGSVGIL